jgi:hypothetical protein
VYNYYLLILALVSFVPRLWTFPLCFPWAKRRRRSLLAGCCSATSVPFAVAARTVPPWATKSPHRRSHRRRIIGKHYASSASATWNGPALLHSSVNLLSQPADTGAEQGGTRKAGEPSGHRGQSQACTVMLRQWSDGGATDGALAERLTVGFSHSPAVMCAGTVSVPSGRCIVVGCRTA